MELSLLLRYKHSMTRLILMRHAKSSWNDPALSDHDRPLNARGRHAAQQMADALILRNYLPDVIICSTALRTRKTLAPLLQQLDGTVQLTLTRALYEAQAQHYPEIIQSAAQTNSFLKTMLIIGHNFAIQDAALGLTINDHSEDYRALKNKFPTGAAAVLDFETPLIQISAHSARLVEYLRPRDL